jgi:hypothetical protein
VGYQALKFSLIDKNGFGDFNTSVGYQALGNSVNGEQNTALGMQALYTATTGSNNTAVGFDALQYVNSGTGNIALGAGAGTSLNTGNNNIYIGNIGVANESGTIRIGSDGTHTSTFLYGTVYVNNEVFTSDRNAKENFTPVDNAALLAKVAALPMARWNYKKDAKTVQHIGPMAQDFQAAFGLDGPDDQHISVVDEGGVALAAIQGLNQKLQEQMREKDAEIAQLQAKASQVDALQKQLNELAAAVKSLTAKN